MKTRSSLLAIVSAFVLIPTVFASFTAADWKFQKQINVPSNSSGFAEVALDDEVLQNSANLSDLRIISEGQEVPYELREPKPDPARPSITPTVTNNVLNNGQRILTLDLAKNGFIHSSILLPTGTKNFKDQVVMYASEKPLPIDSKDWSELKLQQDGFIFNFADPKVQFDQGEYKIRYSQSTARYIKVVLKSVTGPVADITANGIQIVQEVQPDTSIQYQDNLATSYNYGRTFPTSFFENTQRKSTEITIDSGLQSLETHGTQIIPTSKNFQRKVTVQTSDDGVNWNLHAQDTIFDIATPLYTGRKVSIEYSPVRSRFVRLIIFNDDNSPLTFQQQNPISVWVVRKFLLFPLSANANYTLYYGNNQASTPKYDISMLSSYIPDSSTVQAKLASQSNNSDFKVPVRTTTFEEDYPYALDIILVLLVAGCGFVIFRYVKKV